VRGVGKNGMREFGVNRGCACTEVANRRGPADDIARFPAQHLDIDAGLSIDL
jgi:hypothetical protein